MLFIHYLKNTFSAQLYSDNQSNNHSFASRNYH